MKVRTAGNRNRRRISGMVKLLLTTEQWVNLKFTVALASINAQYKANLYASRAAEATGAYKETAANIAESYRKEAEMCERMEALVKSAEFAPDTKEETPCGN